MWQEGQSLVCGLRCGGSCVERQMEVGVREGGAWRVWWRVGCEDGV